MANREGLSPFFPQEVAARKKYIFPLYLLVILLLRVPFFSYRRTATATCNQTNIAVNQSFDPFWSAIHENTSNPSNEGKCIPCLSAYLPTKCREWFLLSRLWYVYLCDQIDLITKIFASFLQTKWETIVKKETFLSFGILQLKFAKLATI